MKRMLGLLLISTVVSCGRAPEIKKREPLFSSWENQVVLSQKADPEVVIWKYKNSIVLKCDFLLDGYISSFSSNLAAGEGPRALSLRANNGKNYRLEMRVQEFDIVPEALVESEGKTYQMKQTPVVKLVIRGMEVDGDKEKRSEKELVLNERLRYHVTDLFSRKEDVMCTLHTDINPDYADDWVDVTPKPETAPENPEVESAEQGLGEPQLG